MEGIDEKIIGRQREYGTVNFGCRLSDPACRLRPKNPLFSRLLIDNDQFRKVSRTSEAVVILG